MNEQRLYERIAALHFTMLMMRLGVGMRIPQQQLQQQA